METYKSFRGRNVRHGSLHNTESRLAEYDGRMGMPCAGTTAYIYRSCFSNINRFQTKLLIFTDRLTCSCATHIMPEGEGVKNDLINYQITSKPLKVLGYGNIRGIDLKIF